MLGILVSRPGRAFSGEISWDFPPPPRRSIILPIILKGCWWLCVRVRWGVFEAARAMEGAKAKTWEAALIINRKLAVALSIFC